MRILVTGASGFIGTALCPALAARGHQVVPLARERRDDLTGCADWRAPVKGCAAVIHLAAIAHRRGVDRLRLRRVNAELPAAIGRACADEGAHLLFLSSVMVQGEETGTGAFDELSPVAPRDDYGRSKAQAEAALRRIPGLRLTVFRPPLVYGPGVKANFLALLRAVAAGWPLPLALVRNRRSLVYVGNLADAIGRAVETAEAVGRTFMVSDPGPVSTPDLCREIAQALGVSARLLAFPVPWLELVPAMKKLTRSLVLDDREIRSVLAWVPPYSRNAGLERTAQWYRARTPAG